MTYITQTQPKDPVASFQEVRSINASAPDMEVQYRIARVGGRPLEFVGTELGMAMSFHPDAPWWYEFNIYKTLDGFILTIKRFHVSADETDYCRAWQFEDLDSAIHMLETYDAALDVKIDGHLPSPGAPAAELAAAAFHLRAEIADARSHFASLVGEFLHDLDSIH